MLASYDEQVGSLWRTFQQIPSDTPIYNISLLETVPSARYQRNLHTKKFINLLFKRKISVS